MKRILTMIIIAGMVAGLTACGSKASSNTASDPSGSGEEATGDTADAGSLDEIIIVLPRSAECLDDVDFVVADEIGYFKENGISVTFEEASGTSDMTMVSMGKGDICFPDPDVFLIGIESNLNVKAFYQRDTIAENCLVVNSDSDIKELKDIAGHSIAVGDASWSACINPVLIAAGVDPDSVEYVVAGDDRAQMVISGKVDSAFSWEKGYQLWQAEGLDIRPISFSDYVEVPGNPLVATTDCINNNKDVLTRFCKALAEAEYFVTCNPEAATKIVMERFPSIEVEEEDAVEVINAAIKLWSSADGFEENGYGYINTEAWEDCIKYAKEAGVITKEYSVSDLYTDEFVKGANNFDKASVKADAEGYK